MMVIFSTSRAQYYGALESALRSLGMRLNYNIMHHKPTEIMTHVCLTNDERELLLLLLLLVSRLNWLALTPLGKS
jgi:hypothetical protein